MSAKHGLGKAGRNGSSGPFVAAFPRFAKWLGQSKITCRAFGHAVVLKADNGMAESINSRIKMVKVRCRGFRNKKRFRSAIYFHLGGLDLYPEAVNR